MTNENIRRILATSLSLILIMGLQIQSAAASDFVIGLSDITIEPSTIYAGTGITVKGDYSVSSTSSARIRLELLFDGNVVDSITEYRSTGNYDVEFTYTPSSSSTGNRDIGIRARIYDNNILKDEDIITKNINIHPIGTDHSLEITSITSRKLVSPSERFPVDVEIHNTGDSDEYNMVISAKIGGRLYLSPAFSIGPGKSVTKTIYVTAPSESGNYELATRAYNSYVSTVDTTTVEVQRTFISLTLKKTSANIGEWIEISGYATRGLYASEGVVSLYLDSTFSGNIPTRENGYYSTKVKFDAPGGHQIRVMASGLITTQTVYISSPQAYPYTPSQATPQQIVIPGGNYTAIIIVTGESQYVVYPEAPKTPPVADSTANATNITQNLTETKKDKYANASFVNIDISANELDAVQNSGNLLKITITNHLGKTEQFAVSTDFDKKWTYIPGAEGILNNEKKIFEIYFTPDISGTFEGNVFVLEKDKIIKTIPVSLFVAPRKEADIKETSAIGFPLGLQQMTILAAAVIFTIFLLWYAGSRKHDALEPKILPPSQNVSEILKAMSSPFSEKNKKTEEIKAYFNEPENVKPKTRDNIFFVPRDKIIV